MPREQIEELIKSKKAYWQDIQTEQSQNSSARLDASERGRVDLSRRNAELEVKANQVWLEICDLEAILKGTP